MEQETLRVRKIIRNLLDFSRQKTSWMQPADLLVPLQETSAFVKGAAESSSVMHPGGLQRITGDCEHGCNEMKQVFINIINNALQAMPGGGNCRISVDDRRRAKSLSNFADTGVGISQENMKKIFEPFFSTKESGDGTGLAFRSATGSFRTTAAGSKSKASPERGLSFKVFLPLTKKPALSGPIDARRRTMYEMLSRKWLCFHCSFA